MQTDQGQQAPAEQQEQPQEQQPAQQEAAAQGSDLDDVGIADLHQQVRLQLKQTQGRTAKQSQQVQHANLHRL